MPRTNVDADEEPRLNHRADHPSHEHADVLRRSSGDECRDDSHLRPARDHPEPVAGVPAECRAGARDGGRPMTSKSIALPRRAPVASSDWYSVVHLGYAVICGVLGVFFLWAVLARLDGGAVAQGVVSVESNRKTLQHLEGGIVREIFVRDGDLVKQGQVLVRLDPTRSDSLSELYRTQLTIALAQEARLLSEREMAETIA